MECKYQLLNEEGDLLDSSTDFNEIITEAAVYYKPGSTRDLFLTAKELEEALDNSKKGSGGVTLDPSNSIRVTELVRKISSKVFGQKEDNNIKKVRLHISSIIGTLIHAGMESFDQTKNLDPDYVN
jgi:hypothetical protein